MDRMAIAGEGMHPQQPQWCIRACRSHIENWGHRPPNREVKHSVSNGEILRDLTTYLCCVDPYPQSQQRHKVDNFWNKAK